MSHRARARIQSGTERYGTNEQQKKKEEPRLSQLFPGPAADGSFKSKGRKKIANSVTKSRRARCGSRRIRLGGSSIVRAYGTRRITMEDLPTSNKNKIILKVDHGA